MFRQITKIDFPLSVGFHPPTTVGIKSQQLTAVLNKLPLALSSALHNVRRPTTVTFLCCTGIKEKLSTEFLIPYFSMIASQSKYNNENVFIIL
jgi:hypothetical protein